jgi:hypothetical protein
MPVHVGEINSTVMAEPEPTPTQSPKEALWERLEEQRELRRRICRDRDRVRAEGFDD